MTEFYGSVDGVKNNLPKLAKFIKDAPVEGSLDIGVSHVEAVLTEYSGRVDTALAGRYVVPFAAAPAVIASIVTDLASAKISLQFQTQISQEENMNILAMRKDAKELLSQIAKGAAALPGVEGLSSPDELDLLFADEPEIIFDLEDPATWQAKYKG